MAWLSMAIVLTGLLVLLALEGDDSGSAPSRSTSPDVPAISARVERLRAMRFRERPMPVRISAAQTRRDGLRDFDRSYPPADRRADEEVLKLLGLLEPGADLREISAKVFGEGVAGYYDPRSKHLRIVTGVTPDALGDVVLAHELTHALEDQRFGLDLDESGTDDAALAALALVEGSATLVMQEYLVRYVGTEKALSGLLGSTLHAGGPDLPPFIEAQQLFPYTGGMQFVQALKDRAGGSWKLVDLADRLRVPDSTEQVLHPDKWVAVETPLPVRLDVPLHDDWRRVTSGTWGEWQTNQLLGGDQDAAAAGWGGDRYELWQRSPCTAPPCRDADALVMRWRWDSERDAREFVDALETVRFKSASVVAPDGDTVTLVLAPTVALARRLAASS